MVSEEFRFKFNSKGVGHLKVSPFIKSFAAAKLMLNLEGRDDTFKRMTKQNMNDNHPVICYK